MITYYMMNMIIEPYFNMLNTTVPVQCSPNMRAMRDMSDMKSKMSHVGWFYVGLFV